jgi:hypothetical protein
MTYGNCTDTASFLITLNPHPELDPIADINLCNYDPLFVQFSGTGVNTYNWTKISGDNITNLPTSGVGDNISVSSLINDKNRELSATYKVTAGYSHALGICIGDDQYFTITVNPTPVLVDIPIDPICSGSKFVYTAMSPTQGVSYSWRRIADADINDGNTATGTSQFINETLTNTGNSTVTVTYEFTLTINGCSETYQINVDVYPTPTLDITNSVVEVCQGDSRMLIPFTVLNRADIECDVIFDIRAKAEGFKDIIRILNLRDSIVIGIPMPKSGTPPAPGDYYGIIRVKITGTDCYAEDIPFIVRVLVPTRIITQPISMSGLCEGDDVIRLSVQAEGSKLQYQWYFNGVAISGATDSVYETPFTMDLQGEYYVIVTGTCGFEESVHVTVTASPHIIGEKWDDVLYIGNPGGLFVRYQWYKNGAPIVTDATSQYYTNPKGFVGTYRVRAYYADGSYIESCPITLNNPKKSKMVLFPNPVRSGEIYKIQLEGDYLEDATLEVYDVLGKFLESHPMNGDNIELRAWYAAGSYSIRIITKDQGIKVLKLIVQ